MRNVRGPYSTVGGDGSSGRQLARLQAAACQRCRRRNRSSRPAWCSPPRAGRRRSTRGGWSDRADALRAASVSCADGPICGISRSSRSAANCSSTPPKIAARRCDGGGRREHERRRDGEQDDAPASPRPAPLRLRVAAAPTSVRSSLARRLTSPRVTRRLPGSAHSAGACRARPADAPPQASSRAARRSPRTWPRPRCAAAARSAGSRAAPA